MKKITIFIFVLFLLLTPVVHAVSTTPIPTQTEQNQIEKIKEMVASKVAELNLVEKRGILGTVKNITGTKLTVADSQGSERIIDTDELTKFQDDVGSSKTFGISDIKKGEELSFIGLFNKDTERLLSRLVVRTRSIPIFLEGIVDDKNLSDFTLSVIDENGTKKTINIENTTKTIVHTEDGLLKSGFSKIGVGERILVAGFFDTKDKSQINATRVTHFEDIPPSPLMAQKRGGSEKESTTSSGGGKKITPITQ